jgi:hypothetical protein
MASFSILSQPVQISLTRHGRSHRESGWSARTTMTVKFGSCKGIYIRNNWLTCTAARTTPPMYNETSSTAELHKSKPIHKPYLVPYGGFLK